jgi:hypothetical protein
VHMLHSALFSNLEKLGSSVRRRLQSIAIDGTSATALLVDRRDGAVMVAPKLYNEGQPDAAVAEVHVSTGINTCEHPLHACSRMSPPWTLSLLEPLLTKMDGPVTCYNVGAGHCTRRAHRARFNVHAGQAAGVAAGRGSGGSAGQSQVLDASLMLDCSGFLVYVHCSTAAIDLDSKLWGAVWVNGADHGSAQDNQLRAWHITHY